MTATRVSIADIWGPRTPHAGSHWPIRLAQTIRSLLTSHDNDRPLLPCSCCKKGRPIMAKTFKIGDHVSWNSEAGRVSGTIIAIHTTDFDYKGHVHRASEHDPQYEIKSDKTEHIAAHKNSALDHA